MGNRTFGRATFLLAGLLGVSGMYAIGCGDAQPITDDIGDSGPIGPRRDTGRIGEGDPDLEAGPLQAEDAATGDAALEPADTGTGQGSWQRYGYDMAGATWSAEPLSALFRGANAPPTRDLKDAAYLQDFDRLYVFANDGGGNLRVHVQTAAGWAPPVAFTSAFAACAMTTIDSVMVLISESAAPAVDSMFFVDDTKFCRWEFTANSSTFKQIGTLGVFPSSSAPPRGTNAEIWALSFADRAALPAATWREVYLLSNVGKVHRFYDGDFQQSWNAAAAPFFDGKAGAPNPLAMRAAYGQVRAGSKKLYFYGP